MVRSRRARSRSTRRNAEELAWRAGCTTAGVRNEPKGPAARPTVVVAGASGFVGQALARALAARYVVVGLSRHPRAARPGSGISAWRPVDLVSRSEAEQALKGARFAVFLVHSRGPSVGLPVSDFEDLELLAADNFARAAASAGVEQIVSLRGLGDETAPGGRRLDVERVLGAHGVPVTTLRAAPIVGKGGATFEITSRLLDRLPLLLLPAWTRTPTQPIALDDVVREMVDVLGRREAYRKTYDIGGPEVMTYRAMLERTAAVKGRTLHAWDVSVAAPRLSAALLSIVTGAPRARAAAMVASLRASTVAKRGRLLDAAKNRRTAFDDAVSTALLPGRRRGASFPGSRPSEHFDVRALQRVALPEGADARWLAAKLAAWLPRQRWPFVTVKTDGGSVLRVVLDRGGVELLRFERVERDDEATRVVFRLSGGLLWRRGGRRPRLEIRAFPGEGVALVSLHDFSPRLPWALYLAVQLLVDRGVMRAFARAGVDAQEDSQRALDADSLAFDAAQ